MLSSEHGFSVIELLIALAMAGLVLTGLVQLAVNASQSYEAQNGFISMQSDARAAMEFMVRELRQAIGPPTISTTVTANDTISFNYVDDSGYASLGSTLLTLNDALKTWTPGAFAPTATAAYTVRLINGTGTGQARSVTANTATQVTVSPAWATAPDTTSLYVITSAHRFTRTSATDHLLRYRLGATGADEPLAEQIMSHAFTQVNASTFTLTLTARTKALDPATKQYRTYVMAETVRRRNQ
jgi:prepilin-type N-terminal cleavage/methylation domain-containing protein